MPFDFSDGDNTTFKEPSKSSTCSDVGIAQDVSLELQIVQTMPDYVRQC
jgi:hypothetical protein